MTSPFPHTLFALGLTIAFIGGCKSAQRGNNAPAAPSADITSDDIQRAPGQPIEEILKGRVAGVTVTRAGDGGIAVRIRGATSIYGSNEPLYVLDGIPITPGPGGSLTGIDPYDIESIEVLKNPSDTALYGMRGANGVIVIKTKTAARKKNPS
jgi:TonB-dependent SusC/RagA subfamily outer membrane receptor